MNLKEIRDAMFAQADWAPTQSPEAITRANNFINRAYNQLALEAPFLFFESKVHLATEPDVTSQANATVLGVLYGDRVQLKGANTLPGGSSTKDQWTWQVTYPSSVASSFTTWKYDRSWDGRMIEIELADGTKIRNQIRSIWLDTSGGLSASYYTFTLVHPWDSSTYGDGTETIDEAAGFKYRIFTDAYALPDDLIELRSARLRDEDINYPLDVYGQREAEEFQLDGPPSQVASGIPRCIFRRQHIHMRGPSVPPAASPAIASQSTVDAAWLGPEPAGTFEYKVTYTWGKRDVEFQLPGLGSWEGFIKPLALTQSIVFPSDSAATDGDISSRNRFRTPRFESPPSAASASVEVKELIPGLRPAVKISLPNITYALGYLNSIGVSTSTYTRQSLNQSGVYIRIYRKRTATNLTDYGELLNTANGLSTSQLDVVEDFLLLAEMRADSENGGIWYDTGEFLPDHNRRLRDIHGYQTMQFYPKPDKRYVTEIRAVTRPPKLTDDQDTPLIHAEAINVLLERAMVYLYENMGNAVMSQVSEGKYQEALLTLSKRYGDLRTPDVPVLRRMTRATGYRTGRKWNRRLSTDDLGGVVE
jgi:hypothetical protein